MRTLTLILTAVVALAFVMPTALAHSSQNSDDGVIRITWGMLDEPATTDSKNRLDLIIRYADTMEGVPGVHEMDLTVELVHGDSVLPIAIEPQRGREAEGRYTSPGPITFSQPGIYSLHVHGVIDGSEIDLTIAGHTVHTLESTYFPPRDAPTNADLQAQIDALRAELAALNAQLDAQTGTPVDTTPQDNDGASNDTPALGLLAVLGVLGAVAAVTMRRRG